MTIGCKEKMKKKIMTLIVAICCIVSCSLPLYASGFAYCDTCEAECAYIVSFEYINDRYHAVRYWCVRCGNDILAGCDIREHNGDRCRYCEPLPCPDDIRYYESDYGILIVFDEIFEADSYIVAVYKDTPFWGCDFFETDKNWIWILYDEYDWFYKNMTYKVRVQAVAAYQASLFSEPIEIIT